MNSYIHLEMIEVHLVTSALKPPPFLREPRMKFYILKIQKSQKNFNENPIKLTGKIGYSYFVFFLKLSVSHRYNLQGAPQNTTHLVFCKLLTS